MTTPDDVAAVRQAVARLCGGRTWSRGAKAATGQLRHSTKNCTRRTWLSVGWKNVCLV
jgi:hypothetical protein